MIYVFAIHGITCYPWPYMLDNVRQDCVQVNVLSSVVHLFHN